MHVLSHVFLSDVENGKNCFDSCTCLLHSVQCGPRSAEVEQNADRPLLHGLQAFYFHVLLSVIFQNFHILAVLEPGKSFGLQHRY